MSSSDTPSTNESKKTDETYSDSSDSDANAGTQIVVYSRRKRKQRNTDSDDDFQDPVPPKMKRGRKDKGEEKRNTKKQKLKKGGTKVASPRKKEKKTVDYTSIRVSPNVLVRAISYLSDAQRNWVRSIGLGVFLDSNFNFREMPHKLGFRIVQSLSTGMMQLEFRSGSVRILEQDVEEVLGLPRGINELDLSVPNKPLEDRWAKQFAKTGKKRLYIYAEEVLKKISDENEVTDMFKCNFLVLVFNTLIRASTHAALDRHILQFHGNFDELAQYNWCKIVINSIKDSKDKWQKNPRINYTGPLLFLLLLYVDRVIFKDTRVTVRMVPTWASWTDALLQQRSNNDIVDNQFGVGVIQKGLWQEVREPINAPILDFVAPDPQPSFPQRSESDEDLPQTENQPFREDIFQKFKRGAMDLVSCIYNYTGMLKSSRSTIKTHPDFKDIKSIVVEALKSIDDDDDDMPQTPHKEQPQQQEIRMESKIDEAVAEKETEGVREPEENVETEQEKTQEAPPVQKLDPAIAPGGKFDYPIPSFNLLPREFSESQLPVAQEAHPEEQPVTKEPQPEDLPVTKEPQPEAQTVIQEPQPDSEEHPKSDELWIQVSELVQQYDKPTEEEEDRNKKEESKIKKGKQKGKEKMDVVSTEIPVLRQDPRPAPARLSPFLDRAVKLDKPASATEKMLFKWLKNNDHPNLFIYAFESQEHSLFLEDLLTLRPKEWLTLGVVSIWSYILNKAELSRSKSTPLRVFFSPFDTLTMISPGKLNIVDVSKATQENFSRRLEEIFGAEPKIEDIAMAFFPVLVSDHFYLICFNLKNISVDVIDNSALGDTSKYGTVPKNLQSQFCTFLSSIGHASAGALQDANPGRLRFPWRTKKNHEDCGVFVMRHMETFPGRHKTWNSGLKPEGRVLTTQINRLRAIYLEKIITSPLNKERDNILNIARDVVSKM